MRKDKRYTVTIEFCGNFTPIKGLKLGQSFIARFCGDWIGSSSTKKGAKELCKNHKI